MIDNNYKAFDLFKVPITQTVERREGTIQYEGFMPVAGVTSGKRFLYYIVDTVFYYIIYLSISFILGMIDGYFNEARIILSLENNLLGTLIWNIFAYFIYFIYYFTSEKVIGTSIAKLIFGYIVIDEAGNKPSTNQLLKRSISRLVPFEAFSCFAWQGWHDRWSNTYVISKKEIIDLKTIWQSTQI